MRRRIAIGAAILFFVFVGIITFGHALSNGLSHDEHQFVAPAVLLAREGLLPYRDVPLFHQPYLIFIDAALVKITGTPFLAARLFSGATAFLTGALLFYCGWLGSKNQKNSFRIFIPFTVTLLWLTSSLFNVSSGRNWNHDLSAFCALVALTLLFFSEKPRFWHWLGAGFFAGLATGVRLTYAPFAVFLPFAAFLFPRENLRFQLRFFAAAFLGLLVALAPSFWMFLQSPAGYHFGNFQFPRLPLLEIDNSRILKTTTPWRKIRFFLKEVCRENPFLFLPAGVALYVLLKKHGWALFWLALALGAGAFAPSRYEMQHFYIFAPLAAFLIARNLPENPTAIRWNCPLLTLLAVAALISGHVLVSGRKIFRPSEWGVSEMEKNAAALRGKLPGTHGKILTLSPIVALEAGYSIYPGLATGPFGWKFSGLLPEAKRRKLGLFSKADLPDVLQNDPPVAILTGLENEKLEKPLVVYALKNGFVSEPIPGNAVLWHKR